MMPHRTKLEGKPNSVPRLARNRSGNFEIRWTERDGEGRPRTRTYSLRTSDRGQANDLFRAWISAGQAVEGLTGGLRVRDLLDRYLAARPPVAPVARPREAPAQVRFVRYLSGAALGGLFVGELRDARHVRDYVAGRLAKGLATGSVRREVSTLKAALAWGKTEGLIPPDWNLPVALPPDSKPRTRRLTEAQEAQLWDYALDVYMGARSRLPGVTWETRRVALFVLVALEAPAREATIRTLTMDRVDLDAGFIDFRDPERSETKKRRVVVPISDRLKPVIQRAVADRVLGVAGASQPGPGGGYLLGSPQPQVYMRMKTLLRDAGVPWVSPHDLRRTWGSIRASWGVPIQHVAQVLGDRVTTTERHYAHLAPDYLRQTVNVRGLVARPGSNTNM